MTPEQRQELLRIIEKGEEISPEWARILFPPEKREYELVYHGKDREEDIIADTLTVPLQAVRTSMGGAWSVSQPGCSDVWMFDVRCSMFDVACKTRREATARHSLALQMRK